MLIVRVELSSAITKRTTEIARMEIIDDGSGTEVRGNYNCHTLKGRSKEDLDRRQVQRAGQIKAWPRQRLHVWNLVAAALERMVYNPLERV